ncbi:hypothetical protein CHU98_g5416 [Xylaria longipes]|nr:hypothetical protein CHU98_g5416 [Xylaria longipes]
MALTTEGLGPLNDDYMSSPGTSEEFHHLLSGYDGQKTRFMPTDRDAREKDNLEYWEGKAQSVKVQFMDLYAQSCPPVPQTRELTMGQPQTILGVSRKERKRRLVEAWIPSLEDPARDSASSDPSQHPAVSPGDKGDRLPIPSTVSQQIAMPYELKGRPMKRKRSCQDDRDDDRPGVKRPAKRRCSGPAEATTKRVTRSKVVRVATDQVLPRRSARIAALPEKTYSR